MPADLATICGCGRRWTLDEWRRLPWCGEGLDGYAYPVAMRNCVCGSTLAIPSWRDAGDDTRRPADRRRAAARRLELAWLMSPGGHLDQAEALC